MTDSNLNLKTISRNNLWYGQFDCLCRVYLDEASVLRYPDHDKIDRLLEIRKQWGQRLQKAPPGGGSWASVWKKIEITEQCRQKLHDMADFVRRWPGSYRMNIWGDWIHFYSLGLDQARVLKSFDWLDQSLITVNQILLIGSPGTVVLKSPKHSQRTYLRNRTLNSETFVRLRNLLLAQPEIRVSPALLTALDRGRSRIFDHYFIDHDSDSVLTMLALAVPGIIRRTLPITSINT